jgi:hypothetical protein
VTTIKAHFDGKTIIPDEPLDLPVNRPLTIHIDPGATGNPPLTEQQFEELMAEMDRDAVNVDHFVDWSRDSIYSGTIDDPR